LPGPLTHRHGTSPHTHSPRSLSSPERSSLLTAAPIVATNLLCKTGVFSAAGLEGSMRPKAKQPAACFCFFYVLWLWRSSRLRLAKLGQEAHWRLATGDGGVFAQRAARWQLANAISRFPFPFPVPVRGCFSRCALFFVFVFVFFSVAILFVCALRAPAISLGSRSPSYARHAPLVLPPDASNLHGCAA
jgi:hypothetical protein